MKIKKGDTVLIQCGKDRGKRGKVLRVIPKDEHVVVEGVNEAKRRKRARREGQKGQVVPVAMPLHASNVILVDGKKNTPTRVGYKLVDGKKIRISKKTQAEV